MKYLAGLLLTLCSLYGASEGMKLYGRVCVECHGDDGKDISIAPKIIAGQSGVYEKLSGYQKGTFGGDQKATMQESLKGRSDESLKQVAQYVEGLK